MGHFLSIVVLTLLLAGCASMTTGIHQSVSVETEPEKSAICNLTNDKGTWFISSTPGSVIIHKSYGDLTVVCNKGQRSGTLAVKSSVKGMTFGNVLAGGVIGAAVDMGTGGGYDYPSTIHVSLN